MGATAQASPFSNLRKLLTGAKLSSALHSISHQAMLATIFLIINLIPSTVGLISFSLYNNLLTQLLSYMSMFRYMTPSMELVKPSSFVKTALIQLEHGLTQNFLLH